MAIDVTVSEVIRAPRDEVARFVMDYRNDTAWIGGITQSELLGDGTLDVGSDVRRVASFLCRRIEYVNRVDDIQPDRRLVMRSVKSPFSMTVTYAFEDAAAGTRTSVRVQGGPRSLYRIAAPLVAMQVRRSVGKDLTMLKRILEAS
jgi:carbon monoxide dehydrogenase subunit G